VVGFSAGGTTDFMARLLADRMRGPVFERPLLAGERRYSPRKCLSCRHFLLAFPPPIADNSRRPPAVVPGVVTEIDN
jgi:hypothetical protein